MEPALAIVLAAGKGVRMQSELPKVLVPARGRPLVDYVLDALTSGGVGSTIVVVGYRGEDVRAALRHRPGVRFVEQKEQLGTGHAVQMCRTELAAFDGPVVVVTGDSPMLQPASIRELLAEYQRSAPACLLGTLHKPNPQGLGRIVRDPQNRFQAIVEEKDATEQQRQITEVNMSTYVFHTRDLCWALDQLRNHNQQREYYLTDCPGILRRAGREVRALPILRPCEALSVNTPQELAAVELEMERMGM